MTEEQAKQLKGTVPLTPAMAFLFADLERTNKLLGGLLAQIDAAVQFAKKWRDNPDQTVEQCASDIEDLLIAKGV